LSTSSDAAGVPKKQTSRTDSCTGLDASHVDYLGGQTTYV